MGFLKEGYSRPHQQADWVETLFMFFGVRRRPLTHQWSLTSSCLDPFATFNYGLLREMPQVSLDLVVFLVRQRCTHALAGNSRG